MNNARNCLLTTSFVESTLNYYGPIGDDNTQLKVKDLNNYQKAFVHESYYMASKIPSKHAQKMETVYLPEESNERLEFLGDNALKFVMGNYLYQRFPISREGFMTKTKIKIEQTKTLFRFARDLNFSKYLLLSEEVEAQMILGPDLGRNTKTFYEDVFEAFIGSILIDNGEAGIRYANRFAVNVIENKVDFSELITTNDNFKDSLQKFFQKNKWDTPTYKNLLCIGPTYRRIFKRILWVSRERLFCNDLESKVQELESFTKTCINAFKTNKVVYTAMFDNHHKSGMLILGIGSGRRVIDAEQECAKNSLLNLGISLNY